MERSEEDYSIHKPVMIKEAIFYLDPKPNQIFIDATLDGGGHTKEILKRVKPNGKVLGIEHDAELINCIKSEKNLIIANGNFKDMASIVKKHSFENPKGVLFDLGLSSWHLEKSGRGFSFKKEEPLDMRFDTENNIETAARIVNTQSFNLLREILIKYGEEPFSERIAHRIIVQRKQNKILTTNDLVFAIKNAVPSWYRQRGVHFATRTFQALRIAVNNEMENLKTGLEAAWSVLEKDGRLVVISFHSLEHRLVKEFIKDLERKKEAKLLSKKAVKPSDEEIMSNPRARSALLRVCEHL
ncbi:16S rRNA (cytosine(1402)-N(4))-methyltransferase RsmH [Patescibacteria group bacterium]